MASMPVRSVAMYVSPRPRARLDISSHADSTTPTPDAELTVEISSTLVDGDRPSGLLVSARALTAGCWITLPATSDALLLRTWPRAGRAAFCAAAAFGSDSFGSTRRLAPA